MKFRQRSCFSWWTVNKLTDNIYKMMFFLGSTNLYHQCGSNNIFRCIKESKYKQRKYKYFLCDHHGCPVRAQLSNNIFEVTYGEHEPHSEEDCQTKMALVELQNEITTKAKKTRMKPKEIYKESRLEVLQKYDKFGVKIPDDIWSKAQNWVKNARRRGI